MTRLLQPSERGLHRRSDEFDPILEGARYQLTRELSLAIWGRVCADATDNFGRRDQEQAQRRFHDIAARLAARGGRLRPDVGRLTRVGTELDGVPASAAGELAVRVPGRVTLVATEARRWTELGEAAAGATDAAASREASEQPGADDVAQVMAALQFPTFAGLSDRAAGDLRGADEALPVGEVLWPRRDAAPELRRDAGVLTVTSVAELRARMAAAGGPGRSATARWPQQHDRISALFGSVAARGTSHETPSARLAARAQAGLAPEASREVLEQVLAILRTNDPGAPLSGELAARMKAELGGAGPVAAGSFEQVRVHTNEAAAEAAQLLGAQAFTVGHHIYFGRGEFTPGTDQGDRLLRHELTHVAQYIRGELAAHGALELVAESSAPEAEARAAEARPARPSQPPQLSHGDARPGATAERPGAPSTVAEPTRAATAPPATAPAALPATAPLARAPASSGNSRAASGTKATASPVVDLLGMGIFAPSAAVAADIDKAGAEGADVRVKLGKLTSTAVIRVKKVDGGYVTDEEKPQLVPLSHPLFVPIKGLRPVVRVRIGAAGPGAITGYVALDSMPGNAQGLQQALLDTPEILGLRGFSMPALAITNSLEAGTLTVDSQQAIPFSIGGWVNGQVRFGLANDAVTFDAHASVHAKGLEDGELTLSRDPRGGIKGSVGLGIKLGEKFSGKATATYEKGDVVVKGQIHYHSEKLNGTLGIVVADADQAEQMVNAQIDPSALMPAAAGKGGGEGKPAADKGGKRAIAGWGDLDFAFTDWLTGKAKVVYGPTGHVTVIGKIAPPKQIDLMKAEKGVTVPILPQVNIEACYGIPHLADIHVGIGVGLSATAGLGPIYMTDLAIDGIYSTDPKVLNRFSITGALRAQADAGLELTVRGYAGINLAWHAVNIGAEVTGKAGLRAYAEARPTLGYRETASPGAGKKGEYYLQGHLEMAAQPVLSLGGRLFVEATGPLVNEKWQWPIGSLEYPIPTEMGIGADVDYVIGSGKFPEVRLSKPSFDSSKFVESMMDNRLPPKSGRDKQQNKGSFTGAPVVKPTATPSAVAKKSTAEPKVSSGGTAKRGTGMQSQEQQKNVPADKAVADRWNAGMKALEDLRKRAETDPEDSKEIHADLAAIKAAFGFTALTAKREGNAWSVDAAMNPTKKVKINAETEGEQKNSKQVRAGAEGKDGTQDKDGKQGKQDKQPNRRLPKDGEWSRTPGDSPFKPNNPESLGLKHGDVIQYSNGVPDFSPWQHGPELEVPGMTGVYKNDMKLMWQKVAEVHGLPNQTAGQNWLRERGLSPHHAGGYKVQLIPTKLHDGIRHTGGAFELRTQ